MEIDKTTLHDLSIFTQEEEFSIFHKLDFCATTGGKEKLMRNCSRSLTSIEEITGIQETIRLVQQKVPDWPSIISNGTMMVVHKFYESGIDQIPTSPTVISAYSYKLFHGPDFSLVKYSIGHCFDFLHGMQLINQLFEGSLMPLPLRKLVTRAKTILHKEQFVIISEKKKYDNLTKVEMLRLANFVRYHYKQNMLELMEIYYQFDAWYSMAVAVSTYDLAFPTIIDHDKSTLNAVGLYHLLLPTPVAYDVILDPTNNFLFLTGANMAGKSTFIKAVGASVYLAHLGMGVPAKEMSLTVFDGMLSNINVVDNIVKGESYFFNEVQRIKNTIIKINDGRKWLILIDELFKGTNVQDAMKCSTTVIEGLLKIKNSLFILSTHLYEIANDLKRYPNIAFKYFETRVDGEELKFNYELKDGVSNDRLGYLILKREKVIELIEGL